MSEDFIINDIKGEIYNSLSGYLKKQNYNIIRLNLNPGEIKDTEEGYVNTNFFNPLKLIYVSREDVLITKEYIDILVSFVFSSKNEDDPFWGNKSQELLIGIIYLMIEIGLNEEEFNFETVINIFSNLDSYKSISNKIDGNSLFFLKDFFQNKTISKTIESVKINFKLEISKYQSGVIKLISSKSDFEFDGLLERETVIFINSKGNNPLINNFISIFFQQINTYLFNKSEIELERPIINVMDEFANFTKIDKFENWLSLTRQKNIWYVVVVQNISQFENIYGSIYMFGSNFKYDFFLGNADKESYEYFVSGYKEDSRLLENNREKTFDKITYTRFNTMKNNEYILRVKGHNPIIKLLDYSSKIEPLYRSEKYVIKNNYNIINDKSINLYIENNEKNRTKEISEEEKEAIASKELFRAIKKIYPEKIKGKYLINGEIPKEELKNVILKFSESEYKHLNDEIKQQKYKEI